MRVFLNVRRGEQVLIGILVDRDPAQLNEQAERAGLVGTISGNTHGLAIGDIIHGFEVIGVNLGRHGGDIGDIGQVVAGFYIEYILVRGVLVDVTLVIDFL